MRDVPIQVVVADNGVTDYGYDSGGNLLWILNPAGDNTSFTYDPLSRLVAQTDPLGGVTAFDYTPGGLTDKVIDAGGNRTHYDYDADGRMNRTVSPDTGTTTYTYNPDGTLSTKTDANGTAVTFAYDSLALPTKGGYRCDTKNGIIICNDTAAETPR